MVKIQYRKNPTWGSLSFVYSLKDDLHKLIQHKFKEKFKDYNDAPSIDIVDIKTNPTKNNGYLNVIILYAVV